MLNYKTVTSSKAFKLLILQLLCRAEFGSSSSACKFRSNFKAQTFPADRYILAWFLAAAVQRERAEIDAAR